MALGMSKVSRAINTAFVEPGERDGPYQRPQGPEGTYRFSKDWRYHEAVTFLSLYCYNFCWPVRTLASKDDEGRCVRRSPAMAAGLTDHVWSMSEWLSRPAVQHC